MSSRNSVLLDASKSQRYLFQLHLSTYDERGKVLFANDWVWPADEVN